MKNVIKTVIPAPLQSGVKHILGLSGRIFQDIPKTAQFFAVPDRQVFFGYYDVTPFSFDDKLLLAGHAPAANKSPHEAHPVLEVGFYDLSSEKPEFQKIGETTTWNWQQGCRLQWVSERDVIYNAPVDGAYGAVIHNVANGTILKLFNRPIYSVSADGCRALSLNFKNLHQYRRGYGYSNFQADLSDDIILMDLQSGAEASVMGLQDAQEFAPHDDMQGAAHYFNHLSFSPNGGRFMVTHLWVTPQGKRRTRILIINLADGIIMCPDNSGRTSHYAWQDDEKVLIFHVQQGLQGQYILYDLAQGTSDIIFGLVLDQDGHPTITEHLMVTDTYPDIVGLQHIMVCDRVNNTYETIAQFYNPPGFSGEMRCDLHPRINRVHNKICVDAVRDGRRAMVLLDFELEKD